MVADMDVVDECDPQEIDEFLEGFRCAFDGIYSFVYIVLTSNLKYLFV